MARRFDAIQGLRPAQKMSNGWMRVDGYLTRVGVFSYRGSDGKERRELRLPEEVFAPESMESFGLVPVTNTHPPELLDGKTAKAHTVGAVGPVRQDGPHVAATMQIFDSAAVSAVERGRSQLSCGYACDLDMTPGTHPEFGAYDAIQRRIRGNHVALVDMGRAGPSARIRLDAGDACMVESHTHLHEQVEPKPMSKVRIDGIDFEIDATAAQAVERLQARADAADAAKASAEAQRDAEKARADGAAAKVATFDAEVAERVKERVALEVSARKVLGADAKLDGMDAQAVKVACIQKLDAKADMAGKSAAYIDARFDLAMEQRPATVDAVRAAALPRGDAAPALTPAQAYAKRQADAWKPTAK